MNNSKNETGHANLLESLVIACSMYSKIPMPSIPWSDRGMKYALCFFPVVGVVIGAVMAGFGWLAAQGELAAIAGQWTLAGGILPGLRPGTAAYSCLGTAIPILITGGIHMDGFLDTVDARSSFQSRERKLEILKDPHTGAFAIIGCGVYLLLYTAVFSLLGAEAFPAIAGIYVMTRAVSGWSVVSFPKAKKDGLASTFSSGAQVRTVQVTMAGWFAAAMVYFWLTGGVVVAAVMVAAVLAVAGWYYRMAVKEFGGMTGDLAGYFLQVAELVMAAALAVCMNVQV